MDLCRDLSSRCIPEPEQLLQTGTSSSELMAFDSLHAASSSHLPVAFKCWCIRPIHQYLLAGDAHSVRFDDVQTANDVPSVRQYQEAIARHLLLAAPQLAEAFLLPLLSAYSSRK